MNICEKMPKVEASLTGTGMPHCSMYCSSPTVLRHTDLPPALGPEIMMKRLSRGSDTLSGVISSPLRLRLSTSSG